MLYSTPEGVRGGAGGEKTKRLKEKRMKEQLSREADSTWEQNRWRELGLYAFHGPMSRPNKRVTKKEAPKELRSRRGGGKRDTLS